MPAGLLGIGDGRGHSRLLPQDRNLLLQIGQLAGCILSRQYPVRPELILQKWQIGLGVPGTGGVAGPLDLNLVDPVLRALAGDPFHLEMDAETIKHASVNPSGERDLQRTIRHSHELSG